MRKDRVITITEAAIAANNIRSIEQSLGYKIPPGMLDVTQYGDRVLSFTEVAIIANNIRSIQQDLNVSDDYENSTVAIIAKTIAGVILAASILLLLFVFVVGTFS